MQSVQLHLTHPGSIPEKQGPAFDLELIKEQPFIEIKEGRCFCKACQKYVQTPSSADIVEPECPPIEELYEKPYMEKREYMQYGELYEYPYCILCKKWAVPEHVVSRCHQNRIALYYPENPQPALETNASAASIEYYKNLADRFAGIANTSPDQNTLACLPFVRNPAKPTAPTQPWTPWEGDEKLAKEPWLSLIHI